MENFAVQNNLKSERNLLHKFKEAPQKNLMLQIKGEKFEKMPKNRIKANSKFYKFILSS